MHELSNGLFLMGIGMGTVFLFLVLLSLTTTAIYKLVGEGAPPPSSVPVSTTQSQTADNTLIAVITAAITHHRNHTGGD